MTRRTKHRRALIIATIAAAMLGGDGLWAAHNIAHAQEVQVSGPLAGAPAVKDLRLYRKGRLQLEPFFGFTLRNEFTRGLVFGVSAKYHFNDWLGVGGWFGFSVAQIDTDITKDIEAKGETVPDNRISLPDPKKFSNQIGELKWMSGIDIYFVPLRGKLAMFQKLFVDTDLSLFAGLAFVGVEERSNTVAGVCDTASAACLATQTARSTRVAVAPSFGAAFTMYFNEFLGLSIRWRGMPFKWNTSGFDEDGPLGDGVIDSGDRKRKFNHMMTFGLVIYLPTKAKIQK